MVQQKRDTLIVKAADMGNLNDGLTSAICEPVDNSIQSTEGNQRRDISITIDVDAKTITIEDNGVGMLLREQQVRIGYTPFAQL